MSRIDEIKEQLSSSKVADRKKGAKIIGKEFLKELGDDLWAAYLKQINIANSWEAQIMMINSLGILMTLQTMMKLTLRHALKILVI